MANSNESDAKEVSFEEALERIDTIIKRIQSGKSLDSLVDDVKEAKDLIALCERKISWTESELAKMLGDHVAEGEDACLHIRKSTSTQRSTNGWRGGKDNQPERRATGKLDVCCRSDPSAMRQQDCPRSSGDRAVVS